MSLDPNKTYLQWSGTTFPNSQYANFKAPAGSSIDWGDGTIETFNTESQSVNNHTYTDGKTNHTIIISGLTTIGGYAFINCSGLRSITIGNEVNIISTYAFSNCSSLTSVTIPDSVTSIGDYSFSSCNSLTSIIIPEGVTSIKENAFSNCSRLTSIAIGSGLTTIEPGVFYNSTALKTIVLFPETPPSLTSANIFPSTIPTIYVPHSSKEAYKTAQYWSSFADKIESNNTYLSLIRYDKKNKENINNKFTDSIEASKEYVDTQLSNKDIYTYTYIFETPEFSMSNETITFIAPLIPQIEGALTSEQIVTSIIDFLTSKGYISPNNMLPCNGNIGYITGQRCIPFGLYVSDNNLTAAITIEGFDTNSRIIGSTGTGTLEHTKLSLN